MSDSTATSRTRPRVPVRLKALLRPIVTLGTAALMVFTLAVPAHASVIPQNCPSLLLTPACLPVSMQPFLAQAIGTTAFVQNNKVIIISRARILLTGPIDASVDNNNIPGGEAWRARSGDTLLRFEVNQPLSAVVGRIFRLRVNGTLVHVTLVLRCTLPACV